MRLLDVYNGALFGPKDNRILIQRRGRQFVNDKAAFFCGVGLVVGKTISSQKHKNDVKKILSADYMDDHTKVELMQDLNGIKVDRSKNKMVQLNKNLSTAKNKSVILAKKVAQRLTK